MSMHARSRLVHGVWISSLGLLLTALVMAQAPTARRVQADDSPRTRQDGPIAIVKAPAKIRAGDLLVVDASESTGEGFAWVVLPEGTRSLAVDQGRRLVFASGVPGEFAFILAVAKGDRVALAVQRVKVEASPAPPSPDVPPGPAPSPPPGPAPGPGPSPGPRPGPEPTPPGPGPSPPAPLPAGKFGLAPWTRDTVMALELPAEPRRAGSSALAQSFSAVAASVAAGVISQPDAILAQTKQSNNQALGERQADWRPWGQKLAERLQTLHGEGKLRTPDDYAIAWREIAQGLQAVP